MEIFWLLFSIILAGTLTGLCFLVLLAWLGAKSDDTQENGYGRDQQGP